MAKITLQRVYDFSAPAPEHCYLIDRLWPRGISKERLTGVQWLKQVAPDDELRKWFHQHTDQWAVFERVTANSWRPTTPGSRWWRCYGRANADAAVWQQRYRAQPGCGAARVLLAQL